MFSGTVTASKPYIIVKLNAVVSYIIDEPSLKVASLSFLRTSSSISASNSNIAEINGASGCRLGIIMLPAGILNSSTISPVCFTTFLTLILFLLENISIFWDFNLSARVLILDKFLVGNITNVWLAHSLSFDTFNFLASQ